MENKDTQGDKYSDHAKGEALPYIQKAFRDLTRVVQQASDDDLVECAQQHGQTALYSSEIFPSKPILGMSLTKAWFLVGPDGECVKSEHIQGGYALEKGGWEDLGPEISELKEALNERGFDFKSGHYASETGVRLNNTNTLSVFVSDLDCE